MKEENINNKIKKEVENILYYITEIRKESKFPTNYYNNNDEDVNYYFAHLLSAYLSKEYQEIMEKFIDTPDKILTRIKTTDKSVAYFIYKTNADYIMLLLAKIEKNKNFKYSKLKLIQLAGIYYTQASSLYYKIYKKIDGVGLVVQKISDHLEEYASVLEAVNILFYNNYSKNLSENQFKEFEKQFKEYEEKEDLKDNINKILDLWNEWKNTKDEKTLKELNRRVLLERKRNSDFKFEI